MSAIIDFYLEEGTDSEHRYLKDILNKNFIWMERCCDFIQWLFPLIEPSNFNPDAPILTSEDIQIFITDEKIQTNFDRSIDKMLAFLGMQKNTDGFSTTPDFDSRKYTWLEFNHNILRVTRMLNSMALLGKQDVAIAQLEFMKEEAERKKHRIPINTLAFWQKAINLENTCNDNSSCKITCLF